MSSKLKKGKYSKSLPFMQLSNGIKILILTIVVMLLGSSYMIYTHTATRAVASGMGVGDAAVTDPDVNTPETPLASDLDETDSTLVDENDGTGDPDAANVDCLKFNLSRIVADSNNNNYDLNPDRYGGGHQCPTNSDSKADFKVYKGGTDIPYSGKVQAFPNLIRGCSNSSCYTGTGWPKKIADVSAFYATGTITSNNAPGTWDAGYDLWFNRSNNIGPSRGAEILINLNRKNRQPPAHPWKKFTNVAVNNVNYDVYIYRQSATINGTNYIWNFIEYWRQTEVYSTSDMNVVSFMNKTETFTCPTGNPCLSKSWYWTGLDTGFELWHQGYGLQWSNVLIHS